jgi:hypothetical protein
MSCDIANGRLEVCKDSVSGIDAIYLINFGDYSAIGYDGTNTDVIDTIDGVTSLYKFELKGTNSFDQVITSSRENGTSFVEQTLTFTLKKQDATTHKTVKLLSYGRPYVVVKNRNNQFFFAGLEHGMELTTANIVNGVAMGDLNGYTLTMVGTEKLAANLIDCSTETALANTVFDGATIITA